MGSRVFDQTYIKKKGTEKKRLGLLSNFSSKIIIYNHKSLIQIQFKNHGPQVTVFKFLAGLQGYNKEKIF